MGNGSQINVGNQTVLWRYSTPLVGQNLSEGLSEIILPGVYSGMVVSVLTATTIQVTSGVMYIQDSSYATTKSVVRVETELNFQLIVDLTPTYKFLVMRYDWVQASNNYAYPVFTNTPLDTDVVLCRISYGPLTVDNGAKAPTPRAMFTVDTKELFVSPGTGSSINVTAGAIIDTNSSGVPRTITVGAQTNLALASSTTGDHLIILDLTTEVVSAKIPNTPLSANWVVLATVSWTSGLSQVSEGMISNHLWRRDLSHLTNPYAHGIVQNPTSITTGAITDATRTALLYGAKWGVVNPAVAAFRVSAAVTGMPVASVEWFIKVMAQGTTTTGDLVVEAWNLTVATTPIHYVRRHHNGAWDAAWTAL